MDRITIGTPVIIKLVGVKEYIKAKFAGYENGDNVGVEVCTQMFDPEKNEEYTNSDFLILNKKNVYTQML